MSAFSIAPLTDIPPPVAESFPNFIQFQEDGTDLGAADADTVNFSTGLTATRGVGENSNVITVTSEGVVSTLQVQEDGVNLGAADVDTLNFSTGVLATRGSDNTVTVTVETAGAISLTSDVEGDGAFDDAPFPSLWTAEVLVANPAWSFDGATATLTFAETGVYRVVATCSITAQIEGFSWPDGETHYGSTIDGVASQHYRTKVADLSYPPRWTDQVVIQATTAPYDVVTRLYALSIDNTGHIVGTCSMSLVVERIGDLPA